MLLKLKNMKSKYNKLFITIRICIGTCDKTDTKFDLFILVDKIKNQIGKKFLNFR